MGLSVEETRAEAERLASIGEQDPEGLVQGTDRDSGGSLISTGTIIGLLIMALILILLLIL